MRSPQIDFLLEKLAERPIAFHPVFARVLGGIGEALFFQQIYFWSDKGEREDGYIYKTKDEIEHEITLTPKQQDRIRRVLEKTGVLDTQLFKVRGAPTLHYKVRIKILRERIMQYYQLSESSISEMTTETKNNALSPSGGKILSSKEIKDLKIQKVIIKFESLCFDCFKKKPLIGTAEYARVKQLMNKGMTEDQLCDLFDWWFSLGKSDADTFCMRKALSNHQVNCYQIGG